MSLLLEREAIEHFTEDLEVTIAGHLAWFRHINRVFVFSLPVSQAEVLRHIRQEAEGQEVQQLPLEQPVQMVILPKAELEAAEAEELPMGITVAQAEQVE